jgi:hypothetical protein
MGAYAPESSVEVREGVKPDDQVILNPPVNLVEGSRVQPRLEAKN